MSTPPPEQLDRIYSNRFPEADREAKARIWQVLMKHYFQRFVGPGDTVLDLGCGFGEFLNHVRCERRIGVDLNPASPRFLDPGVEFHSASVTDLSFLEDDTVDLVFTSNLMEHLPDKPAVEAMLRECRRVLRPGGTFMALGPNLRFLPGTYWDFWDHLVPLTDRSLVEALETLDYEITEAIPRFLPYTTRSSLPQSPWLVRLYLANPWAWRILGGQFLVRAAKPS